MNTLEITTVIGCPMNCRYCPQGKLLEAYAKRKGDRILSLANFKKILGKLPKDLEIHFSGFAEPFTNPDAAKMMAAAHSAGFRVVVYSTLVGLAEEDLKKIIKIPFEKFVVHLPDKQGNSRIKIDAKHLEMLRAVSASGLKNLSYMTMGDLPAEVEAAIGRWVPSSFFHWRAGNLEAGKGTVETPRLPGRIRCKNGPLRRNVLLPNGEVVLCCMDYGLKHVIGNLLENDYASLFWSGEFRRVQTGLFDEKEDILCRFCAEAREEAVSLRSLWRQLKEYRPVYKIKSKVRKFFNNLKPAKGE